MGRYFVNLPLRYIFRDRTYLNYFITYNINPELGLDAISIDKIEEKWHQNIYEEIRQAGLICSIHLPFHDLQPGSMDDFILSATRKRLVSALKIARIYNPKYMVAHANFIPLYLNSFLLGLKKLWKHGQFSMKNGQNILPFI